jgi:hypothetical protein
MMLSFEMANLYPASTGLPMTVWVSPRDGARHDALVRVSAVYGRSMDIGNAAVVRIRPSPHVIHGHLTLSDRRVVETGLGAMRPPCWTIWTARSTRRSSGRGW